MKVFITGIAGFLGSHLAERMLALGHEVSGCDNLIGGNKDRMNVPAKAKFSAVDCRDLIKTQGFANGSHLNHFKHHDEEYDVLYHCAATAHEGLSVFSPSFITKNIFEASVATFSAAIAAGVKRIVFMSSMARYGEGYKERVTDEFDSYGTPLCIINKKLFREIYPPNPQDPYGMAKVAAGQWLKGLCYGHGVEYVIAVPHIIIGPRQKYDDPFRNVASIMANRMLSGKQPIIYGDGMQRRCFSPVDDVLDVLVRLADAPGISGEIFNVGPDGQCRAIVSESFLRSYSAIIIP